MTNHPMQRVVNELEATWRRLEDVYSDLYRQRADRAHPTPEEKTAEDVIWQARDAMFRRQMDAEVIAER